MPANWGSIAGQLGSLGFTNLAKEAIKHGGDAEQRRKEELRRLAELDQKRADIAKQIAEHQNRDVKRD
jgi:hypothetical protein